jgi:hypothetical protein
MGMSISVRCPNGVPAWPSVAQWLADHGQPAQMRMIDGQLAFPDEAPPADWHELRVALPAGMVTVRREADGVSVVTWGNADAALQEAWNRLAQALAEVGRGSIGDVS